MGEWTIRRDATHDMTERYAVINEAEPGIVRVSTELLHDMLTQLGWRKVEPTRGGDLEYTKPKHEARKPHPNTMAGR